MSIKGECFCGAVKYEIEGEVYDARSCHCSRCRKAFSAQASAYALVRPAEFSWLEGEDCLTSYVGQEGAGLRFCRVCGSTMCGVFDGEVHGVTLGCIDGDPGVKLGMHIFTGSKAAWEDIGGDTPQYDEAPPAVTN